MIPSEKAKEGASVGQTPGKDGVTSTSKVTLFAHKLPQDLTQSQVVSQAVAEAPQVAPSGAQPADAPEDVQMAGAVDDGDAF